MGNSFPEWIRRDWSSGTDFQDTRDLLRELKINTVCQSARCPNQGECWKQHTATFMILGRICTRNCRFCSVSSGTPDVINPDEPARIAEAVKRLELRHAVITSVTRDDLDDGGVGHFAATVRAIHSDNPDTSVEVLIPDFSGNQKAIDTVLDAKPEVLGHNIETVSRLYPHLRGTNYSYETALGVLLYAAEQASSTIIKSGFMVGHGETPDEVYELLTNLLEAGCQAVTIGQYLRPTRQQCEVTEFIHPEQFKTYEDMAYNLGFKFAIAGPFVRSSYNAELLMKKADMLFDSV